MLPGLGLPIDLFEFAPVSLDELVEARRGDRFLSDYFLSKGGAVRQHQRDDDAHSARDPWLDHWLHAPEEKRGSADL